MLGSKQKTLHKSILKFDTGRSFPGGASETLVSADLGTAKSVPEADNASTLTLLAPQVVVRALTNSGGEAPNDLPFAFSLDGFADWILSYEEGNEKLDAFEYLRMYWTGRIERNADDWLDPDSVVLPFLLADSMVNRTTHDGGGSEGTFTALLQKNKDGGAIWGQIKYTPINLFYMQLGAIAYLNEVFLTQDYESVAVPAASAVRAVTAVYLSRDIENLRDGDMDVFVSILSEYQSLALGIASSNDPRGELQEILAAIEPDSSSILNALEMGENIAGDAIADQARSARNAILQKLDLTEFGHLSQSFVSVLLESTLAEVVGLMGALATEDLEDDSSPGRKAASLTIEARLEGPRGSGDFSRVAVGLLSAIFISAARTDEETDEDIEGQISDIYKCVDLSTAERLAVDDAIAAWHSDAFEARCSDWFARRERDDSSLAPVSENEREWVERTFALLLRDALDIPEFDQPEPELLQWWAAALCLAIMRRDQLVMESFETAGE